jgi:hypothetical protein
MAKNKFQRLGPKKGGVCFEGAYATKKLVPRLFLAHVPISYLPPPHLYPHGAHSDQDSIKTIFLLISPLPPQASGGMPLGGSDEEAAGGI